MIQRLNLSHQETLTAAFRLQKDSYEQEAKLIGSRMIPPLLETLDALRNAQERFYGEFLEGRLVGLIAITEEGPHLRVSRLAVAPWAFGRGIASRLLEFALEKAAPNQRTVVSTGSANTPARRLYEKFGFRWVREFHAGEIALVEYLK